ncbi:DUF4435 domain-containing protein [Pantoea agglomerans]|uniref:DUF4435 domain-containing protein n=1 Tax=Enterobacter agglomerans TaxID=549 RepID=UPI003209E32B
MENKAFTRTSGGLNAQAFFYNSDYIVYIEGKDKESHGETFDEKFYQTMLQNFLPHRKITIKVAGSCSDILTVHSKVKKEGITNTFCFIDRDYSGIKFNYIPDYRLIQTYGYSWENDFWSEKLCCFVIGCFTNHSKAASEDFSSKARLGLKRISFLHRVNISYSFFGGKIFTLGSKGGFDGITYDAKSKFLISKDEMIRILTPLKAHPDYSGIAMYCKTIIQPLERVIQGHYLEYVTLRSIRDVVKTHSPGNTTAPENTIKNISFSHFMLKPLNYLSSDASTYYQSKLAPF